MEVLKLNRCRRHRKSLETLPQSARDPAPPRQAPTQERWAHSSHNHAQSVLSSVTQNSRNGETTQTGCPPAVSREREPRAIRTVERCPAMGGGGEARAHPRPGRASRAGALLGEDTSYVHKRPGEQSWGQGRAAQSVQAFLLGRRKYSEISVW